MENGFYSDIAGGLRKSALEIVGVFCNILDTRFKMVHYLIKKRDAPIYT